ncbi:DUF2971 domain-containing protein [Acinetobacter seifertii]|uniref:DUF2971 domain-containing protein n=1 Tax=Acinetobacter seifertii TaxID=1530123 RepID=UPI003F51F4AF
MKTSYKELIEQNIQENYKKTIQDDEYYYLYKHYSLDSKMLTLGVFDNNELKYQYPLYFNDPYDCLCTINLDFKVFRKKDFEQFINLSLTPTDWFKNKIKYKNDLEKKFNQSEYVKEFRKWIAVTCYNNAPLHILMWSHYANNHKGFMLEFRYKKIENNFKNLPIPVIYTDEYPNLNVPWNVKNLSENENLISEFIAKQLLTKSTVWEYEKEFRDTSHEGLFKKYKPSMLSSVVLGSEIDDEDEKAIKKSVQNFNTKHKTNVKVYKTSLLNNKFALKVDGHPRLSK